MKIMNHRSQGSDLTSWEGKWLKRKTWAGIEPMTNIIVSYVIYQKRVRVFDRGFQTPRNRYRVLLLFPGVWRPRSNTTHEFLIWLLKLFTLLLVIALIHDKIIASLDIVIASLDIVMIIASLDIVMQISHALSWGANIGIKANCGKSFRRNIELTLLEVHFRI